MANGRSVPALRGLAGAHCSHQSQYSQYSTHTTPQLRGRKPTGNHGFHVVGLVCRRVAEPWKLSLFHEATAIPRLFTIPFEDDLVPCFKVMSQFNWASAKTIGKAEFDSFIPPPRPTRNPAPLMEKEVTEGHTKETLLPSTFISSLLVSPTLKPSFEIQILMR